MNATSIKLLTKKKPQNSKAEKKSQQSSVLKHFKGIKTAMWTLDIYHYCNYYYMH